MLITPRPGTHTKTATKRRESENRRLGKMHAQHGHGADGQTCKGCVFLVHKNGWRVNGGKSFLKCERYNAGGYDSTDWRSKWPACGAYRPKGDPDAERLRDGAMRAEQEERRRGLRSVRSSGAAPPTEAPHPADGAGYGDGTGEPDTEVEV